MKMIVRGLSGIKIVFFKTPFYLLFGLLVTISQVLETPLFIIATSNLILERNFIPLYIFLVYIFGSQILQSIYYNLYQPVATAKLMIWTNQVLANYSTDGKIDDFIKPQKLDDLKLMTSEMEHRWLVILDNFFKFIANILLIIFSGLIICQNTIILFTSIIVSIVLIVNKYLWSLYEYQFKKSLIPNIRIIDYVKRIFFLPEHCYNNATNDLTVITNKYDQSIKKIMKLTKKRGKKIIIYDSMQLILIPIAYFILLFEVASMQISGSNIFEIILIISSFNWITNSVTAALTSIVEFAREGKYVDDFLKYQKKTSNFDNMRTKIKSIRLSNIIFTYPNSKQRFIIEELKINGSIALVGQNGAGKSTFADIIANFHQVENGLIYLNDENLNSNNTSILPKLVAAVGQEDHFYNLSIAKNLIGKDELGQEDLVKIKMILKIVELDSRINLDNIYSKEFTNHGVEFSKGELQRLFIARALLKESDILILDEAFSAIDLEATRRIIIKILKYCKNKIIIFVTHNLNIAKKCQKIIVIEDGKIIEQGSHKKLMLFKGVYYKMFKRINQ